MDRIRNFCIIAHIDHGKSTLADRLLELTGTIAAREMKKQLLDTMDLEQEKGITIKLTPVRMAYGGYQFNLIDTPGHVDFSYEVSRSLAACEGALVVVDASQGVQAQTLANIQLAKENGLTLIPVVNKIDLPAARPEEVAAQIVALLDCQPSDVLKVSAKTGEGVEAVLETVATKIPAPQVSGADSATKALIFDSYYDDYRGVVLYVRLVSGRIKAGDSLTMMASSAPAVALEVGCLSSKMVKSSELMTGEIGYIVTNLKTTTEARVGDTVTLKDSPAKSALPAISRPKPTLRGLFPSDSSLYPNLKKSLENCPCRIRPWSLKSRIRQFSATASVAAFWGFYISTLSPRDCGGIRFGIIVSNPSAPYES